MKTNPYCISVYSSLLFQGGGAPNRPLPPTPDEEESGDRTLVMKRVSSLSLLVASASKNLIIVANFAYIYICTIVYVLHCSVSFYTLLLRGMTVYIRNYYLFIYFFFITIIILST